MAGRGASDTHTGPFRDTTTLQPLRCRCTRSVVAGRRKTMRSPCGAGLEPTRRPMRDVCTFPLERLGTASLALCAGLLSGCSSAAMELVSYPGSQIRSVVAAAEPPKEEASSSVKVTATKLTIDEKIKFESWSAKLLETSHPILNEVAT